MDFFGPKTGEVCGMYTAGHFAALFVCIAVIAALLFFTRRVKIASFYRFLSILAPIVTALEIGKIVNACVWGYTNPDSWVPLFFCSLFLYSLYLSGFGRGIVRRIGDAFLVGGGIAAGTMFLLMPSACLTIYPLFHYQSIYGLLYHTLMVYVGLFLLSRGVTPDRRMYPLFLGYVSVFAAVAILLNACLGCNLFFLREPYGVPIELIQTLYRELPVVYTIAAYLLHVTAPFLFAWICGKILSSRGNSDRRGQRHENAAR